MVIVSQTSSTHGATVSPRLLNLHHIWKNNSKFTLLDMHSCSPATWWWETGGTASRALSKDIYTFTLC